MLQQELEDSFEKIGKLQEFGHRVLSACISILINNSTNKLILVDDSNEKNQNLKKQTDGEPEDEREDGYFAAYSRHHIHEDMLKVGFGCISILHGA